MTLLALTTMLLTTAAWAGEGGGPVTTPLTAKGAAAWDRYSSREITKRPAWTPPLPPQASGAPVCRLPTSDGDRLLGYRGGCADGTPEGLGEAWIESADRAWLVYMIGEFHAGKLDGTFLRVIVRHPAGFTGAVFFQGRAGADIPQSGTLFTANGLRYWGAVSETFGLTGHGVLRLPNGDTLDGEWQDAVFIKGRYTYADNGDWEEQRAKILPNGKVKHRVVAHYYAPPLGTAADCVPGNNVMITTPGSPKRIRGLVESVEADACGVLIAAHGGSHTSYAFSRLLTTYTAAQKEADRARSAEVLEAYNSVMNAPSPAEDLFQSYLDAQKGYDKKRMEEGTGGSTSDPCADASTAPSYCH